MFPLHSSITLIIRFFSNSFFAALSGSGLLISPVLCQMPKQSNTGDSEIATERLTIFCSSRTLPGQA